MMNLLAFALKLKMKPAFIAEFNLQMQQNSD